MLWRNQVIITFPLFTVSVFKLNKSNAAASDRQRSIFSSGVSCEECVKVAVHTIAAELTLVSAVSSDRASARPHTQAPRSRPSRGAFDVLKLKRVV